MNRVVLYLALALVLSLFVGCGSSEDDDYDASPQPQSPTPQPTPIPEQTPVPGTEAALGSCPEAVVPAYEPETSKGETWSVQLRDDGLYEFTVQLWIATPCDLWFAVDPYAGVSPAAQLRAVWEEGSWHAYFLTYAEAYDLCAGCTIEQWASQYVVELRYIVD